MQLLRLALLCLAALLCGQSLAFRSETSTVALHELPIEARQTLSLIRQGGPFPDGKDGSIFGNVERRLPIQQRGYYREYTVPTPGLGHRGARRIIAGRGGEAFYTSDHYRSFQRIRE